MNLYNLFKISIRAVGNNKMRSFLSMLGIIIGVAAVIIMMSIGQGSSRCRYAWWRASGPFGYANLESG